MPGPSNPRLFGGSQPASQVGGRPPMGQRPMPGGGMPQRPGGQPQQQRINPQELAARELMLKSELLKIQAIKTMMGGGAGKKRGGA